MTNRSSTAELNRDIDTSHYASLFSLFVTVGLFLEVTRVGGAFHVAADYPSVFHHGAQFLVLADVAGCLVIGFTIEWLGRPWTTANNCWRWSILIVVRRVRPATL